MRKLANSTKKCFCGFWNSAFAWQMVLVKFLSNQNFFPLLSSSTVKTWIKTCFQQAEETFGGRWKKENKKLPSTKPENCTFTVLEPKTVFQLSSSAFEPFKHTLRRKPRRAFGEKKPQKRNQKIFPRCARLDWDWASQLAGQSQRKVRQFRATSQAAGGHPQSRCQFARVVKGVDLRSTARKCAWARTP